MPEVGANDLKAGIKVEIEGQPYTIVSSQFVKPGKGQAFTRAKLKNLATGRVIEKTFKSNEQIALADIQETSMRFLYKDPEGAIFMDDESFEQITIPNSSLEEIDQWLIEDLIYEIIFYKNAPVSIEPPTFLELKIIETAPGVRGDTASGRVLKPAILQGGAKVQIPIFIEEGETIKVDTRSKEYVCRVSG